MPDREEWGGGRFEDEWLNHGFVTVPVVLLFDQNVSGGAKATYGAICWHVWRDGRVPPQTELAEELGGGVRTIKRHLAELEGAGYIERVQHGLGRPNDYIIKALYPRGPKMALQGGQQRHFKGAKNGPSLLNQDVTTQTPQQQQAGSVAVRAEDPGTAVVVASEVPTATANGELTGRLVALGVAKRTAEKLQRDHGADLIARWVGYTEHRLRSGWVPKETPAAWVVAAIRDPEWVIPEWFRTPEEEETAARERRAAEEEEEVRRGREEAREREDAEAQREAIERELGIDEETRETWARALDALQARGAMTTALFGAHLLPIADGMAVIATGVEFFRVVIQGRAEDIRGALSEVTGRPVVRVEVRLVAEVLH